MNLRNDKRQNVQGELDFSSSPFHPGEDAATRLVDPALTQGHDPAWSSAAELHREGVDQVVAWFGPVGDRQCTRAEKVFYAALVAGKTARQAVREARQESRKPLRARPEGPEEVVYPLGWAQLALYHRGNDVPTALAASVAPAPARERARVTHKLGPTRHGVPGIEQLRFGFVGRRSTRDKSMVQYCEVGNKSYSTFSAYERVSLAGGSHCPCYK